MKMTKQMIKMLTLVMTKFSGWNTIALDMQTSRFVLTAMIWAKLRKIINDSQSEIFHFLTPWKHICIGMVWKLFISTLTALSFLRMEGKRRDSGDSLPPIRSSDNG